MPEDAQVELIAAPPSSSHQRPDDEVVAQPKRRRFTREYKLRVLRETERCRKPGELAALLRREGLYSSHLAAWRAARDRGELGSGGAVRRGRRPDPDRALKLRAAEMEKEIERLRSRLEKAEAIIEVQKKLSALVGLK